jgi:hypothetical protein
LLLAPFRLREQSARVVVYSYKLILITIKLYIAIILYARIVTILLMLIRPQLGYLVLASPFKA